MRIFGQQARLVVLIEQRVDITAADAEGRREFILEAAACHEALDQPSDAIRMLQLALDEHPDDIAVLKKLEGLYRIDNREDELLENLKMQASPLMWVVATSGDPTAVTLLLEAGADVNARGANLSIKPWTPLMALAQSPFGSPDVVSMLLKAGANANVKTSDGKTALDFARDNPAFKGTKVFQELEAAMKQK